MESLSEYVAIEVNGETADLLEVLRVAKYWGELGFLQRVVNTLLIRQEAARRGIEVSDDELQQAADEFRAERELHKAEEIEYWLAARRLTFADWESQLEDDLLARKLREEMTNGKVEQHFAERKLSFDAATISQITVNDADMAKELRAQITEEGADFHALARQHSIDAATKPAGGYTGLIQRDALEAAAEAAIFGAKAGDILGPLKTSEGWHLIKMEALHLAALNDATRETIKSVIFDEWLAEQRRKARLSVPLLEANEEDEEEENDESE
jgi:putative peptide maturation system protein